MKVSKRFGRLTLRASWNHGGPSSRLLGMYVAADSWRNSRVVTLFLFFWRYVLYFEADLQNKDAP